MVGLGGAGCPEHDPPACAHLVVWEHAVPGEDARDLFAQVLDDQQRPVGSRIFLDRRGLSAPPAHVATASDGRSFVVVWDDIGRPPAILAKPIDASGTPLRGTRIVAPEGTRPGIVFDGESYVVGFERAGRRERIRIARDGTPP